MKKEEKKTNKQREENKTLSEDLLSSYRSALYKIKAYYDSLEEFDMGEDIDKTMKVVKSILDTGAALGKNIETLDVLEKKVAKDEGMKSKVRGGNEVGMFES